MWILLFGGGTSSSFISDEGSGLFLETGALCLPLNAAEVLVVLSAKLPVLLVSSIWLMVYSFALCSVDKNNRR